MVIPLCWARGYGMFKWLRWRRETTRTVAEVANRSMARSSDRREPPAGPDQVEELVGIGANLMLKIHALATMLTLIVPARAVRARAVASRNGGSEFAGDRARHRLRSPVAPVRQALVRMVTWPIISAGKSKRPTFAAKAIGKYGCDCALPGFARALAACAG